ncbi:MAG: hypothetical protein FJ215_10590 [Ignavibacteria bacterium]|nr:hypothetical protein [Ignavibacteria bacterium]
MTHEIIPYGGWQKCLRLANDNCDLIITTEVGPRVIRYGLVGQPNEFVEYPDQMGQTGGTAYRSYGGHRLWVAPEDKVRTYFPDNAPIGWKVENNSATLVAPTEKSTGLQKAITLTLDEDSSHVKVIHRITNRSANPQTLAAWALSVMAPGGRAIFPHEPYRPHPDSLLPVRPLVFWSYTDMTDGRWNWGTKFIQLFQDAKAERPQKIGVLCSLGWAAYANRKHLFVKRFPHAPNVSYADFGCNLELFTNARMLEVESLSPLVTLAPGEAVTHKEEWYLYDGVSLGTRDEDLDVQLKQYLEQSQPEISA